ncbi:hypothetical protein ABPG74_010102 [Tetrahymena malaccensis]
MNTDQISFGNDQSWGKDIAVILFYGVFGTFFYLYSTTPERYSKCDDSEFLDWNKLTMILCLSIVGISAIKLALYICKLTQKCPTLWSSIESVSGIFVLICAIGLTVKDNKDCGDMHTLAMAFYIIVYVSVVIVVLFICCPLIIGAGAVATVLSQNQDEEKKPIKPAEDYVQFSPL